MASRRTNGEGSIYKRKDGRWEAAIYLQTSSGTRKRFRFYADTREGASRQLVAAAAKAQQGIPAPDTAWKLAAYLDYWLETNVRSTQRPKTYEEYESVVRRHLKPGLGSHSLTGLNVLQVQQFLDGKSQSGIAPPTIRSIRKVLSAALTHAMRQELVMRNVARLVTVPRHEAKKLTPWSVEQVQRFLSLAEPVRLYPAFVIFCVYGVRMGEVLGLRWADIDFEARLIHVRHQLQRVNGKFETVPVKTKASRRDLPLLDYPSRVLQDLRGRQVHEGISVDPEDLVVTTSYGHGVDQRNVRRSFHQIRTTAGLPRITVHYLRHTAGTLLKNQGVPARDTQLILGHSHISTTQQFYQHADIKGQTRALTKLAAQMTAVPNREGCRQNQPSNHSIYWNYLGFQSGGPGGTRTHDTLLKREIDPAEPSTLTEVRRVLRRRYCSCLLGAAAVMFSRQALS